LVDLGPLEIKAQLDEHREAFLSLPEVDAVAKKPYPSVRAVVNRFALYAAALRMAITARLLPWSVEEADRGVVMCMARWQRDNVDTAGELQRAADAVVVNIKAALSDRFITIHKPKRVWEPATEVDAIKQKSAGSFDGYAKPDRVLVRREAFTRYCNGVDPHEIAQHLQEQGMLIPDRNGKLSKAEQVIGKLGRFYVLSLTRLTP
jgi:hypothetical protein